MESRLLPGQFSRLAGRPSLMAAPCANALFVSFMHELHAEANARRNKQLAAAFERAAESLAKYPLPMTCGRDMLILDGVGEYIATKVDEKLRAYLRNHAVVDENLLRSPVARKMRRTSVGAFANPEKKRKLKEIEGNGGRIAEVSKRQRIDTAEKPAEPPRAPIAESRARHPIPPASLPSVAPSKQVKEYVPKEHSGAWAVLLTLYRATLAPHYRGWMLKDELQNSAKLICMSSFEPKNGTYYSAWNSVKTLEQHELILRKNRPVQFHLTRKGEGLAKRLTFEKKDDPAFIRAYKTLLAPPVVDWDRAGELLNASASVGLDRPGAPSTVLDLTERRPSLVSFAEGITSGDVLPPPLAFDKYDILHSTASSVLDVDRSFRDYDVVVLIDHRERAKGDRNRIQNGLLGKGLQCETRSLELGDVLWIARKHNGEEYVLDCIAERKIVSDLCASIIDGRYKEQKQRLKKCGVRGLYYIVEGTYTESIGKRFTTIPATSVEKAIASTIAEGFVVQRTATTSESIDWIARTTNSLTARLKCGKVAPTSATFDKFQELAVKTSDRTITETFASQLMNLFQISSDKAFAIISAYASPQHLLRAYHALPTETERMKLLQDLRYGQAQRRIGPNISKAVYQLYCSTTYPSEPEQM